MSKKPTYEELKQRVKELERAESERMRVEKALKPNAEQIDLSNIELENPHLVDGKYSIKDLIDIESLHKTLEKFSLATGFTTGFLEYPSQEVLIATGWRDICTKFHRYFPESAKHCKESNIYLTKQLKDLKELNIKPCENGLVDGATPIVIKGKHIAYLATGQILFEKPDIEGFKKQAEMYGYDLDAYLKALSEVPVVSEDQFKNALSFLSELAVTIAETGLNNLELKERTRELEEEIIQRRQIEKVLQKAYDEQEWQVKERTGELMAINKQLQQEIIGRQQAQEQLARFHQFVEASREGMGWADLDGRVRYINSTLCSMFGETKPEDSYGKPVLEYYSEETQRRLQEEIFPTVLQEGTWTGELVIHSSTGNLIPTTNSLIVLRDAKGNPSSFANVLTDLTARKQTEDELRRHRDHLEVLVAERTSALKKSNQKLQLEITERKKIEKALRESEKRYRLLADNVQDVIWTRDMDLRLTYISPSIMEQRGYTVEEAMARVPEKVWPTESLQLVGKVLAEELEIEKQEEKNLSRSRILEVEVKCKDGSTIWTEAKVSFLRDQNGNPTGTIGVTRDISDRKHAEAALRESEEKYRTVLETSLDPIVVYDVEGKVTYFNPAFTRVFGWTLEERLGKKMDIFVPDNDWPETQKMIEKVLAGENFSGFETRRYNKEGSIIHANMSAAIYRDQNGNPIGSVINLRDISEQKKLETQLQRAQKMEALGILAGGVAHDLNNVLSGIVSYPDLLLMQIPEDSPLIQPILTMQDSGKKAAHIVQDLLTLARRGVVAEEVVNLNEIISEYLKNPEHEKLKSFHPRVEVETSLESDLFNILGSSVHLSKTAMNLVSNAAEAMPDGGKIFISTENRYIERPISGYDSIEEGDYVTLRVSDTGIGISPEDKGRIFEPFYTKKMMARSGTGLGMAVVWGTVKDHKGYIDVQSTEGKGTTFTLYFPATRRARAKEKAILPIESYMGKGESILLVDDAKKQREIVFNLLTTLGYVVDTASSGEKAVDYMKNNTADLLILDMIMDSGIDGLDTYKKIIEIHPGQKAIIASGFSETDQVREAQRLGAGQYIKKPYTLEKIGLAVRAELDK